MCDISMDVDLIFVIVIFKINVSFCQINHITRLHAHSCCNDFARFISVKNSQYMDSINQILIHERFINYVVVS